MEVLRLCVALLALAGLVCGDCPAGKWQCSDGQECIPKIYLCDGDNYSYNDCRDGGDEEDSLCAFTCPDGHSIKAFRERCDGVKHCEDNSDEAEEECSKECPRGFFRCTSGQCIPSSFKCDGRDVDCTNASDETIENCGK